MQLHKLRTLLCSQANHARTSQNIVSGRERAAATDVSRIVAVAHTTMSIGMDNTAKTINQPLVRNRSKTTLGEVVGKVGILSKPPGRKQTHTLPAQGNRNTCWTFHTGQSEEDYIGDLPDRVHSTAFKHKQISKGGSVTYFTPCIYIYMLCSVLCVVCCVVLCCVL